MGADRPPTTVRSGGIPAAGQLPQPRTRLVGRDAEVARTRELFGRTRLLTFTGPGGCGKTRVAIAFAADAGNDFPDGVHFVPLAPIRDPSLVPVSIAQSIGLQDSRGVSLQEHVSEYVRDGTVLLVLDNFEQVLPAGEFVSELLAACPRLRILVTSRAPLHVSGEQEFPIPSLRVPDPDDPAAAVADCESVQLFVARAAALLPGFTVDEQNAAAIAGIVRRLDGLPLAIELAAARVKLLPPAAILARLEDSLSLLVSPGRDVPDRQRTLRATISWSYELLSEPAQRLLVAISVFRGGASLDGVEAVGAAALESGVPVLDALQELVDHSLVRVVTHAAPRYATPETIREFTAERLTGRPEAPAVRAAHATQFTRMAADLARPPLWPGKDRLDQLELEHDNFRAALDWYRQQNPAAALELANRLTAFWSARGHFSEGRRRLHDLLDLVPGDDPGRIDALCGIAWLATDQGDRDAAAAVLDESIALARARPDPAREATALNYRGRTNLIIGTPMAGQAVRDIRRALELQTAAGDEPGVAAALWFAGLPQMFEGDVALACRLFERSAELAQVLDLPTLRARALQLIGICRLELNDLPGARVALAEGVPAIVDIGDRFAIPVGLTALAGLAALGGRSRAALRLAGAATAYEDINHTYRPHIVRVYLDKWLAAAGIVGTSPAEDGRRLALDDAIALGLREMPGDVHPAGLTGREAEVAALVARGLTNREIAGRLYLSVRTVEVHVDHALTKLGFRTRTQLAAWAATENT